VTRAMKSSVKADSTKKIRPFLFKRLEKGMRKGGVEKKKVMNQVGMGTSAKGQTRKVSCSLGQNRKNLNRGKGVEKTRLNEVDSRGGGRETEDTGNGKKSWGVHSSATPSRKRTATKAREKKYLLWRRHSTPRGHELNERAQCPRRVEGLSPFQGKKSYRAGGCAEENVEVEVKGGGIFYPEAKRKGSLRHEAPIVVG